MIDTDSSSSRHGRRHRRSPGARLLAGVVALIALALLVPMAASADTVDASAGVSVTKVDARDNNNIEVVVAGDATALGADAVTVSGPNGELEVSGVASSRDLDRPTEIVFVVDTNARSARGQVLESVKQQLLAEVASLPSSTSVAIISAGDTAVVSTRLTTDRERVVDAIESLSSRNGSVLFNAVDRAGTILSQDPGVIRSVVIVSTGPDTGSDITLNQAQVAVVQRGAQVISITYDGGEPDLAGTVERTGGQVIQAPSSESVTAAVADAMAMASDRLVVTIAADAEAETGTRGNVTLSVAGAETTFSFPPGILTEGTLQLRPQAVADGSGLGLFRTSTGLYIAIGLAFIGITMGIWAVGSILAAGKSDLEGVLAGYADGTLDPDSADVDELIVQSALLQRAVSFSESFAEKRGFLARVEDLLERANLPVRAGEAMFILAAVTFLTMGIGLVLTGSILAAIVIGAMAVGLCFFIVRLLGRRRLKAFESQLPDTLQLLSGTLRAGYSLPQGFEVVSHEIADPMGQELRRAMTEARLGRDLEDCLEGVATRLSSPDFAWTVMAVGIQREVGGNLNELLNNVADTMIARERLKREIGALTAEGKMSAAVLSFLPPGLGFVMWIMNPEYVNLLFTELLGNILLGLGIVSGLIGLAWMKKVISIDV